MVLGFVRHRGHVRHPRRVPMGYGQNWRSVMTESEIMEYAETLLEDFKDAAIQAVEDNSATWATMTDDEIRKEVRAAFAEELHFL